jgi:hypothetical protein
MHFIYRVDIWQQEVERVKKFEALTGLTFDIEKCLDVLTVLAAVYIVVADHSGRAV